MRHLFLIAAALPAAAQTVDFDRQIRPILEQKCLPCHDAEKGAGGLRLHTRASAAKALPAIVPLLDLPSTQRGAMPPGGPQLPAGERDLIRRWIAAGAPWPETTTIGGRKSGAPAVDERETVRRLRERIAASKQPAAAEMKPYKTTITGTDVAFEMVPIPGGEFTMGTPPTEKGRRQDEGPQQKMKVDPFWMGKFEVTWDEYRLFMFSNQAGEVKGKDALVDAVSRPTRPYVEMSFGMGINGYPAISMTQHAANKYAEWLTARTGQFYRLPTEAEWEYACRAGTNSAYSFGDDPSQLSQYAWYADNSNGKYEKVGTKKPNPWGLYDMHGNVMEWTLDQYTPKLTGSPWVQATKPYPHAVRGGSWNDDPSQLRCGARVASDPSWKMQDPQLPKSIWYHTDAQWLGFRLVRPLKLPSAEEMFRYWNNGVEKED